MQDIELTERMIERIDEADYSNWRYYHRKNRTRFYKWIVGLLCGDVEVHTFAVKTRKDGETIAVKEVQKASVDGDVIEMKDLILMRMGGYTADWSAEKLGRQFYCNSERGKWASEPYTMSNKMWHVCCPVINPEVLSCSDRFRYCAFDQTSEDILDYLKMYKMHPRIEFLAKAGVPHLTVKPGFIKQVETDKSFMTFFSKNIGEIKESSYGIDVIRKAYKLGISLSDADSKIAARRVFRGDKLPISIDAQKALEYTRKNKVDTYRYCRYIQLCLRLGLDVGDTKNAFPKSFKRRTQIVIDECAALDRREKAELAAKMAKDLKSAADKYAAVEKIRGAFVVRLPRQEKDFTREGAKLHHCIGNGHYSAKMARGETLIAFIRMAKAPNVPFVTLEYSPEKKRFLQCYAIKNSKPPDKANIWMNKRLLPAFLKASTNE